MTDGEERVLLQDYLTLFDLSSCKQSPSLARRLPDHEGRTGRLVDLPVLDLALLGTIEHLPADTTPQWILGDNFTNVAGIHLYSYGLVI